ncbi:MAG: helix-turn-helix transcriptional regulator [Clostridium septicum]|uniref:helix-turn-helix transcriptional regulator n=1 Tax=Clostridium septicum TaxID=1504 RepID=UPI0025844BAF|nr:helix-turn-helix transcriptional regulator [Clostridium septicum]MDU1314504.1 helix-turn-helix transcriptional regulator [Clostridium septicum]
MKYDKLKGIMREKGYSQKNLANKMGVTVQSLNSKLNGRTQFTIEEALNIICILKLEKPIEIFFQNHIPNTQQGRIESREKQNI